MIALPPSLPGSVQLTTADFESATAVAPVGADGVAAPVGVTAFEAADSGPCRRGSPPRTRNVYEVPAVSPVMFLVVAGGVPETVVAVCAVEPM